MKKLRRREGSVPRNKSVIKNEGCTKTKGEKLRVKDRWNCFKDCSQEYTNKENLQNGGQRKIEMYS